MISKRKKWLTFFGFILLVFWWFSLPKPLFKPLYSTVIESQNGELLGAKIAADGQWRFPKNVAPPKKLTTSIIAFEDRRFDRHLGFDIRAFFRAMQQNWRAGRIVSGGSTISMQVIRLSKQNPSRTVWQKIKEVILAIRLELRYSKAEILHFWSVHAPFGGNVVGFEAATWRYYGKPPKLLSWAEAATLAVLPNSPALIHPGRNQDALEAKRNRLLLRLFSDGRFSETDYELALLEPLPEKPHALPQLTPHLLSRAVKENGTGRFVVTIDPELQQNLLKVAARNNRQQAENGVHNLAILVLDNHTGQSLAYIGNAPNISRSHSPDVDIISAPRSPGSVLKPLLYSLALQNGRILPGQMISDVPTTIGGFRPENYYLNYTGTIPADKALAKSLNIPFVFMLQDFGVPLFHHALQEWQFDYIQQPPGHYGLSLILGGCEVNLWQVAGWYSSAARLLNNYYPLQGRYHTNNWQLPKYLVTNKDEVKNPAVQVEVPVIGAAAAWHSIAAMEKLERPDSEGDWEQFDSSRKLAWKTGTSFGFRDAWAIGITPKYTIAVWVGNADGEGRPGLVGVKAAAPVLFDVLQFLPPEDQWFEYPFDDGRNISVCSISGFRASGICPTDSIWVPKSSLSAPVCPYHETIYTNANQEWRLHQLCTETQDMQAAPWFVLPPLEAYYYQKHQWQYRPVPPWHESCKTNQAQEQAMQLVYPQHPSQIRIPIDLDGEPSATVFTVAHQNSEAKIHWHIDDEYIGTTHQFHTMELRPPAGRHRLVLVDQKGNRLEQVFTIVD